MPSENEEFEFRKRLEDESSAQPSVQPSAQSSQNTGSNPFLAELQKRLSGDLGNGHRDVEGNAVLNTAKTYGAPLNYAVGNIANVPLSAVEAGVEKFQGKPTHIVKDYISSLRGNAPTGEQRLSNIGVQPGMGRTLGGAGLDLASGALAAPLAISGAQKALSAAPEMFGNLANQATIEHLRPTQARRMALGDEGLDRVAQETLQSGAMKFGSKATDTADALEEQLAKTGEQIGSQRQQIASQGFGAKPEDFQSAINDAAEGVNRTGVNQAAENRIKDIGNNVMDKLAPNYQNMGETAIPFDELAKTGTELQQNINYNIEGKPFNQGMKEAAGNLRDLETQVAPEYESPLYRSQMDRYSNLSNATQMAGRTAGLANGGTGLLGQVTDAGVNSVSLNQFMNGNPLAAIPASVRAVTKGRISSMVGTTANTVAKKALEASTIVNKLTASPGAQSFIGAIQAAAQKGPDALATTHFLLQQTSPEYQEAMRNQ